MKDLNQLLALLGSEKDFLLHHVCKTISKDQIHLPGKSHIDTHFLQSNRNAQAIRSLAQLYQHGRLGDSGYISILPVDQGIEQCVNFIYAQLLQDEHINHCHDRSGDSQGGYGGLNGSPHEAAGCGASKESQNQFSNNA